MSARIERTSSMKTVLAFVFALLLSATSAFAAESKSVTYKSGDEIVHGRSLHTAG